MQAILCRGNVCSDGCCSGAGQAVVSLVTNGLGPGGSRDIIK